MTRALLLLALSACCPGDVPEMPPEGSYTVENQAELSFQVVSVVVKGDLMTITYLDPDGAEQWVTYQIPADEG